MRRKHDYGPITVWPVNTQPIGRQGRYKLDFWVGD